MNDVSKRISDIGIVPVIKLNTPERDAAPVLGQMLAAAFGGAADDGASGMELGDATAQATMFAMPLKGLASFVVMPDEQYQAMLGGFRAALQ